MLKYLLKTIGVLCVLLGSIHGAEEAPPQNPIGNWQKAFEVNIPENMELRSASYKLEITHYPNRVSFCINPAKNPRVIGRNGIYLQDRTPEKSLIVVFETDSNVESFSEKVEQLRLKLENNPLLIHSFNPCRKHSMSKADKLEWQQILSSHKALLEAGKLEAFFEATQNTLTLDLLQRMYNELNEQKEESDFAGEPVEVKLLASLKAFKDELALRNAMGG